MTAAETDFPRASHKMSNFIVTENTTAEDVAAAGRPDPLYCKPGLTEKARLLADSIDAELGGETSCGGAGIGYVPQIVELEPSCN
jgi:hypothetical protein